MKGNARRHIEFTPPHGPTASLMLWKPPDPCCSPLRGVPPDIPPGPLSPAFLCWGVACVAFYGSFVVDPRPHPMARGGALWWSGHGGWRRGQGCLQMVSGWLSQQVGGYALGLQTAGVASCCLMFTWSPRHHLVAPFPLHSRPGGCQHGRAGDMAAHLGAFDVISWAPSR